MFFNYDSFELFAAAVIVLEMLITYSFYNSSGPINNESLVNTNSSLDSISKLHSNIQNLPNHSYVDVGVQTETNIQIEAGIQAQNTYTNTGMQTSARMWLESIKNWIDEILGNSPSATTTNSQPGHVDVGVQTNGPSMWNTVKQWFLEVCSVRSSELSSMGQNKVSKWRNKLDSKQSIDLHDSESSLTTYKFGIENES